MVYGKGVGFYSAVLAGEVIPAEDLNFGQFYLGVGAFDLRFEANDRGSREMGGNRIDVSSSI